MIDILSVIDAPSGNEENILKFIKTKIKGKCETDSMGNLIFRTGKEGGKRIMFYTPVDEDAFVAMSVENEKVYFAHLGKRKVKAGDILSFSGYKGAVASPGGKDGKLYFESFHTPIEQGQAGVFDFQSFSEDTVLCSKEAASKAAISAFVKASERDYENDIYFVFGVKNKMGGKGLIASLHGIKPDVLYIFEETDEKCEELTFKLMFKGGYSSRDFEFPSLKTEISSEKASLGAFSDCGKTAVIGIPVKYAENMYQTVNIQIENEIIKLIEGADR